MEESQIFIDYGTLKIFWWALLGFILIAFAILGGTDLGVAFLMPFIAKSDMEKRILINSVGPVWESNQVWLILGGAASFGVWPTLYSVSFSNFYYVMFLVLIALIVRPVGFDYRNKLENHTWRKIWDICLFVSGFVPAVIFGVAFGNLFMGAKFNFDHFMFITNTTKVVDLLNPFGLFCGIFSLIMLTNHAAIYLMIKTDSKIAIRAKYIATTLPSIIIVMFIAGGVWVKELVGFKVTSSISTAAPASVFLKTVEIGKGFWMNNFEIYPMLYLVPAIAILMLIITLFAVIKNYDRVAYCASASAIFLIIANAGFTLFPFFLPSITNPNISLTVFDSSSSYLTLFAVTLSAVILIPIIIAYVSWVYYIMRGKVTADFVRDNSKSLY
jgi:cytochrome bd ubiquinol oxidase subunit II